MLYGLWFNYHHNTCGHLYQGRYKAILVDADKYLVELSRYVHLNPVRKVRKFDRFDKWRYISRYRWSSLPGYISEKKAAEYIDYSLVLGIVGGRRAYQGFLVNGLKNGLENPFENVRYQMILGSNEFVARVKQEFAEKGSVREQPIYRDMVAKKFDPERVVECVLNTFGVSLDDVRGRYGSGILRGILSDILYRYSGMTLHEIGGYLGIDYSSVNKLRSRLKQRMEQDKRLVRQYNEIVSELEKKLSNV